MQKQPEWSIPFRLFFAQALFYLHPPTFYLHPPTFTLHPSPFTLSPFSLSPFTLHIINLTVSAATIIPVRSAVRAAGMVQPVFLMPTLPK